MRRRDFFKVLGIAAVAPAALVAAPPAAAAHIAAIDHDDGSLTTSSSNMWETHFHEGDYLFLQGDFGLKLAPQNDGAWL